jgi:hypothetical protein
MGMKIGHSKSLDATSFNPEVLKNIYSRYRLEVPLILQPDNDFQSLDAIVAQPEFWLEMPLSSDRPIPFQCAVSWVPVCYLLESAAD